MKKLRWIKLAISAWLIYHIITIVVLANGGSLAARRLEGFLLPYANTLGLNTSWNFFSPDPAHTMYFEYRVRFEDEQGSELQESLIGFIPEQKTEMVLGSSQRRLLYAMRFLIVDPRRLELMLVPWLCRKYPGASGVSIKHYVRKIPLLDQVLVSPKTSVESLQENILTGSETHRCHKLTQAGL